MIYPARVQHLEYTHWGDDPKPSVVYTPGGPFQQYFPSPYGDDGGSYGEPLSPKEAVEAVRGWTVVTVHFDEVNLWSKN